MRTCQFCGAVLESAASEESSQAELFPGEPRAALPREEAAPEAPTAALPFAGASAPLPDNDSTPNRGPVFAQDALPAQTVPGSLELPRTDPAKTDPGRKDSRKASPKNRLMTSVVLAGVALLVVWVFIFVGYRVMSGTMGGGSSSTGSSARHAGVAASDLGVDIYPGARPASDVDRRDSAGSTVVSQSFLVAAKLDLVIDFYKARMVGQTAIYASGAGVVVSINPSPQDSILIAIAPAQGGETRITITHTAAKD
jgi:hypothetical protein